ncbi:hypothetical protein [Paraburkholderia sp. RL17-337-BIB-A]|uniref:hypothetical protein n=1 Tax=Paraburkholderia sp. RL17-337-BIB-A TaxID=3031636 RepID=UPI0038B986D6
MAWIDSIRNVMSNWKFTDLICHGAICPAEYPGDGVFGCHSAKSMLRPATITVGDFCCSMIGIDHLGA